MQPYGQGFLAINQSWLDHWLCEPPGIMWPHPLPHPQVHEQSSESEEEVVEDDDSAEEEESDMDMYESLTHEAFTTLNPGEEFSSYTVFD